MRDRITTFIALALLAAVTATSYWYSQAMHWHEVAQVPEAAAPDAFAEKVALTEFDVAGRARLTLFADSFTHRSDTDEARFVAPVLVSRRPDQPQVEVRSQTADVEDSGVRVLMHHEVHLARAAFSRSPALELDTDELLALPDDDRYQTDRPVIVLHGQDMIDAVGMDFDNVARTVEFKADVHATIVPRPRKNPS